MCGPIQENSDEKVIPYCRIAPGSNSLSKQSCYIIPYFSQKFISVDETQYFTPLKVDVCFNGLPIPGYVYHILTAIYVDFHLSELNQVDVGTNGACVSDKDGTLKYFLHNSAEKTVSLLVMTNPATITSSWKSQLSSLQHLTSQQSEVWKGAHYVSSLSKNSCQQLQTLHGASDLLIELTLAKKLGFVHRTNRHRVYPQYPIRSSILVSFICISD